jgi:hypothetical protein
MQNFGGPAVKNCEDFPLVKDMARAVWAIAYPDDIWEAGDLADRRRCYALAEAALEAYRASDYRMPA